MPVLKIEIRNISNRFKRFTIKNQKECKYVELNIYERTNSSPFIKNNSLYTNIDLHTDLSIDINLNMYMRINIGIINISLY